MPVLVPYATFKLFREAAIKARTLAVDNSVQTQLKRSQSGWEVRVPPETLLIGIGMMERSVSVHEEVGDHYVEEDYYASSEADSELREELAMDQDDWARSEEEGWYYGDE